MFSYTKELQLAIFCCRLGTVLSLEPVAARVWYSVSGMKLRKARNVETLLMNGATRARTVAVKGHTYTFEIQDDIPARCNSQRTTNCRCSPFGLGGIAC